MIGRYYVQYFLFNNKNKRELELPMIDGIRVGKCIRQVQNLVFHASMNGRECILRFTSPEHRAPKRICEELKLLDAIHKDGRVRVAKPLLFPSGKYFEQCQHNGIAYNAVLFSYIEGVSANTASPEQAFALGKLLATLHTVLSELKQPYEFPALSGAVGEQLIHGDFNCSNVLVDSNSFAIIDFEDACYSTYEFELANSIYLALFDARSSVKQFDDSAFIQRFLEGYTRSRTVNLDKIRSYVDLRVWKLAAWLQEPASAPIAIASSSDSWKRELSEFVRVYDKGEFDRSLNAITKIC